MSEQRCASCKHWFAMCKHNVKVGDYCHQCDCENRRPSSSGFISDALPVVTPGDVRRGHCARGDAGGGEPDDETTLMWGQDGSDYRAQVYTLPTFGCVMWESKP